jgi:hypothetical protein
MLGSFAPRQPFAAQSPSIMPVFPQQLSPLQRSKPNPTSRRVQERQGHAAAAAAAAAVMLACSVAAAHAAQQVAAYYSLGTWGTAALSGARLYLAATSLPDLGVAIFAGGSSTCCHVYFRVFACCFFWLGNGMVEWAGVGLLFACASLMPCAAGSVYSNAVDIFNVTSWSTAALSVARHLFAATSLPDLGVAIFAGGSSTCCHVYFRVFACCFFLVGEWDAMVEWAKVGLLFA